MPSLPRIRRTRSGSIVTDPVAAPEPAELSAAGLTWIHLVALPAIAARADQEWTMKPVFFWPGE